MSVGVVGERVLSGNPVRIPSGLTTTLVFVSLSLSFAHDCCWWCGWCGCDWKGVRLAVMMGTRGRRRWGGRRGESADWEFVAALGD